MTADAIAAPKPKVNSQRIVRLVVPLVVALVTTILATFLVRYVAFLTYADRFLGDWEIAALTAPEPQSADIVVVAITEDTLKAFPYRSPIDRQFLNDLLTTLAARGPRAIGLDILFDQPTEPQKDARLAATLKQINVPLVVSYTDDPRLVDNEQQQFLNGFVPARERGLATLATDQFDTVRWIYPGHAEPDGSYLASFPRALAADLGVSSPAKLVDIAWHGRPSRDVPAFREYSAELVPALPAEWFKNKIVLIGTDITLADRHRTPFATVYEGGDGVLPGIVVQAHALSQLIEGRRSPAIGGWQDVTLAFACALVGAALPAFGGAVAFRFGTGALFLVAYWILGALLFRFQGTMIGLIAPTISLAGAHWTMEGLSGHEARKQREFITGAFSRYVSPKVVQTLIRDPSRMSLEGERRVMSFLFTDLANFTTLSESLEPHDLAALLNQYFNGMTDIVLKYDGTICKFEGDAVFVIFNAPTDQPDHAERAVRCALDMDRFAESFRIEHAGKGMPFGHTRIGIHTGPAVVGNFGSWARFDYTALGDSVNVGARLEGVNKQFGTRICISEGTAALTSGINFRPLGAVVVKGKTKGITVLEPLHDDDPRGPFLEHWAAAFQKLEDRSPDALALLKELQREEPQDRTLALHIERLQRGEEGAELVLTEK
jgi:adenylate cyclase